MRSAGSGDSCVWLQTATTKNGYSPISLATHIEVELIHSFQSATFASEALGVIPQLARWYLRLAQHGQWRPFALSIVTALTAAEAMFRVWAYEPRHWTDCRQRICVFRKNWRCLRSSCPRSVDMQNDARLPPARLDHGTVLREHRVRTRVERIAYVQPQALAVSACMKPRFVEKRSRVLKIDRD